MSTHPWTGRPLIPHWRTEVTRRCNACQEDKPITAFRLNYERWRYRTCRECQNAKRRGVPKPRQYDRTNDVVSNKRHRRAKRIAERDLTREPLPPRNWWSVRYAAFHYGKSPSTIRLYVKTGVLEARRDLSGRVLWIKPRAGR